MTGEAAGKGHASSKAAQSGVRSIFTRVGRNSLSPVDLERVAGEVLLGHLLNSSNRRGFRHSNNIGLSAEKEGNLMKHTRRIDDGNDTGRLIRRRGGGGRRPGRKTGLRCTVRRKVTMQRSLGRRAGMEGLAPAVTTAQQRAPSRRRNKPYSGAWHRGNKSATREHRFGTLCCNTFH